MKLIKQLIQAALQLIQRFSPVHPKRPFLLPLRIAKYIYSNHSELFIGTTMGLLHETNYRNIQKDELITSSLNNVHCLAVIFLGLDQAKRMLDHLANLAEVKLSIRLPSGREWPYTVKNLLRGSIVPHFKKEKYQILTPKQQDNECRKLITPNIERYFRHLHPLVEDFPLEPSDDKCIETFEKFLSKLDYNFNKDVTDSLTKEIIENSVKVRADLSFFYCVAGILIDSYRELFAIEQRFCSETGQNQFIVYESEIKKKTMSQCLEKYGETGLTTMTLGQINNFIENLEKNYCQKSLIGDSFPVFYKDREITGLSLRYISAEFSPQSCIYNLMDLARNNSELKSQLDEMKLEEAFTKSIRSGIPTHHSELALEPFRLVRRLSADHWKTFMPAATKVLFNGSHYSYSTKEPLSSCARTFYVVSSLYLGKNQAQSLMKRMCDHFTLVWEMTLPNQTHLKYKIKNLFAGIALYYKNRGFDEDTQSIKTNKYSNQFFESLKPGIRASFVAGDNKEVCIQKIDEVISNSDYKFNNAIIRKLLKEMMTRKVTSNQSYLYCVAINHKTKFDHAFIIEHYLSPFTGKPRFRRIESWILEADLRQDFINKGYGAGDEGTMDIQGLLTFFGNLFEVYEPNENRSSTSYFKCFGYNQPEKPLTSLINEDGKKTLHGYALRYLSYPFNPKDCINHLNEMLEAIANDRINEVPQK